MPTRALSGRKIRRLLESSCVSHFNKSEVARDLRIARTTATRYINAFQSSQLTIFDIELEPDSNLARLLFPTYHRHRPSARKAQLLNRLEAIHNRIERDRLSILDAWREEVASKRVTYKYSQFYSEYTRWRNERGLKGRAQGTSYPISLNPKDQRALVSWQRSNNRRKWEIGTTLIGLSEGRNISELSRKIGRGRRTIKKWCATYLRSGLDELPGRRTRKVSAEALAAIALKKARLIRIIHESPSAYGINRASWSLQTLSIAYHSTHGDTISISSVSQCFKSAGYKFKKAKKSLTSNDPDFREKLDKIKGILSRLSPNEKFFSIDEFGPFSVKRRGGVALVPGAELRTIPQKQKSKGSLICTAALELATNQVTHFYSKNKNSEEMIKLLRQLVRQYSGQERIFVSWDSASWHASKALLKCVEELNDEAYRNRHNTPTVELAPLPAGAQFLNVIESVFSGMSRAVLHNSDYKSVTECQAAIDAYFARRNKHFLQNPKRAGNKIWGMERVAPVFNEENNCKDPNWR